MTQLLRFAASDRDSSHWTAWWSEISQSSCRAEEKPSFSATRDGVRPMRPD